MATHHQLRIKQIVVSVPPTAKTTTNRFQLAMNFLLCPSG